MKKFIYIMLLMPTLMLTVFGFNKMLTAAFDWSDHFTIWLDLVYCAVYISGYIKCLINPS